MNSIPNDILRLIANNLNKQTFLTLSECSTYLYKSTHDVAHQWYVEEGSHPYATNYGDENPAWMNLRVTILANKIWHNKQHAVQPIQYKLLRPITIEGMKNLLRYSPVNLRAILPNAFILFSEEGCRFQQTQLAMINKNPLSLEYKAPIMKGFSKEEVGSVIAALQKEDQWFLLSNVNSSIAIVFIDFSKELVKNVIDLKVNEVTCHHYYEGILTLGLKSGLLLKYSVTKDEVAQIGTFSFNKPISSMASLPNGDTLVTLEDEIFLLDALTNTAEAIPNIKGKLVTDRDSIYVHNKQGELYEISLNKPVKFQLICTEAKKFFPFGNNVYLIQDEKGYVELKLNKTSLCRMDFMIQPIKTADWKDGILAVAYADENKNQVSFFEMKSCVSPLRRNQYFKNPIHALQFSKTLELIVTLNDGSIHSFLPFKV